MTQLEMSQIERDSTTRNNTSNNEQINKTNGVSLQLELLANTNVLTIRIKWVSNPNDDNEEIEQEKDSRIDDVVNELTTLVNEHKGSIINPIYIESYEFLDDTKRHLVVRTNNYTFETATVDFKKSYNDDKDKDQEWLYQTVLQCQFKNKLQLDSILDQTTEILDNYTQGNDEDINLIDKWSISANNHALKHPGNIFIGNIHPDVSLQELNELCEVFGPILSIKLINNNNNNNNSIHKKHNDDHSAKNFGFVSFQLGSQASKCINELNGKSINGVNLLVNYHVERKERERLYWNQFKYSEGSMIPNVSNNNNSNVPTLTENGEPINNNSEFNDLDDNNFKCVFIGNLPKSKSKPVEKDEKDGDEEDKDETEEIITGDQVVEMVNENLKKELQEFEILSYYFPLENHEDQLKGDTQSPLKGYGFIKVKTHDEALKCIDSLNLMEWYGNKLVVNRAIQNRISYSNNNNGSHNNSNGNNISRKNSTTNMNNVTRKSFSRSSSYLDFVPQQYMNLSPYSQNMVPTSSVSSLSTSSSMMKQVQSGEGVDENNMEDNGSIQSPTMFSPPLPVQMPNFIAPPMPMGPMSMSINNPYTATIPRNLPIPLDSQQESNLYVKHLPLNWSDENLKHYYENFGKIISVKIITVGGSTKKVDSDNENGEVGTSKGYGFVCFENPLDASRAIMATNGVRLDMNHVLEVSFANKKNINNHKNNNNVHQNYSEPRYNPKFLNALLQEQNPQFMYNQSQGFPQVGGAPPHPSMMLSPQHGNMSPTNYQFQSNATNPMPAFVPVSTYGPIPMQFPNQQ